MTELPVGIVAVVRHREAVLVGGGEDGDPTLPTAVLDDGAPEAVLADLLSGLGLAGVVERRGERQPDGGLVPFLVTATERSTVDTERRPAFRWEPPALLLRRAHPRWWRTYRAVAPSVATVSTDAERGSTAIAVDALWTLRDAAAVATERDEGLDPVRGVALDLLAARPSMAALGNRIDRAMTGATTPAAVEATAGEGIVRAVEADAAASRLAAETVDGGRVLTLSRSGTTRAALLEARPAVVVLASRPGGEGLAVADELAGAGLEVSTCADAAVYDRLRTGDVDAVLVGADAVTPPGGVVNKVGTWATAHAARQAGVPCYAVCASDKIRPADGEGAPPLEPFFDLTPPSFVTAVLTERGRLPPDDVAAVAEAHAALADWRR